MIAIGRVLQSDSHEVRLFSTDAAREEIAASGLQGEAILPGFDDTIERIANPPRPIRSNPLALIRQFRQTLAVLDRLRAEVFRVYASPADRPDLVIVDSVLPAVGLAVAEQGLPWWTSTPSPCAIEPRRGTPGYLGGWRHREDTWGRMRDRAGRQFVRMFKRAVHRLHRGRMRALGLPQLYRKNGDEAIYSPDRILGLGMPELEFPRVWPAAFRFVGPQLYTPAPPALPLPIPAPQFDPGYRHVLVTMGTHVPWIKDTLAAAVEAFVPRFDHVIFHFSDGSPLGRTHATEARFRRYPYIPYEPHLPHFDLVIHHGGTGAMYQCVRAGIPAVVLPVDYDHFDHAARLDHAGIGLRVDSLRKLEPTLRRALNDPALRSRSQEFQAALQKFDPPRALRNEVDAFFNSKRA